MKTAPPQWLQQQHRWSIARPGNKFPIHQNQPPEKWWDYAKASAVLEKRKGWQLSVLGQGEFTHIDLDGVLINGKTPEEYVVDLLGPGAMKGFWEVSMSGKGLHGYFRGSSPKLKADHDRGYEVYTTGDFRQFIYIGQHTFGEGTGTVDDLNLDVMGLKPRGEAYDNDEPMPDITEEDDLPDYRHLLNEQQLDWLDDGELGSYPSNSEALFGTISKLYCSDLDDGDILGILLDSESCRQWAEDKHVGKTAEEFLWYQILANDTRPRAADLVFDDGEVLPTEPAEKKPKKKLSRLIATHMGSVKAQHIDWLWSKRIAFGRVTVLAGAPGTAKSQVMMRVAAHLSRGVPLPDNDDRPVPAPASTLMFSLEDSAADTMKPRAVAVNADLQRIIQVRAVVDKNREGMFSLDEHIPLLGEYLEAMPGIRLILIDPLNSYLTSSEKKDIYNDAHMRRILTPLADFAEKTGVAVVAITHLRKNKVGSALDQVMGSVAVGGVARIVLNTLKPENAGPAEMALCGSKSNIAPTNHSLHYDIETCQVAIPEDDARPFETSRVNWGDVFAKSADDHLGPNQERGRPAAAKKRALDWIAANMEEGKWELKTDIEERLIEDTGISKGTMDRFWKQLDDEKVLERRQLRNEDARMGPSEVRRLATDLDNL
jgi:putative DNA primase/helicase